MPVDTKFTPTPASAPPYQPDSPELLVLITLHIGLDMLLTNYSYTK